MKNGWLTIYVLFMAYFHKVYKMSMFYIVLYLWKAFIFNQQSMLDANSQNSKQEVFISQSVSLLESERIICLNNSGGNAYVKDWRKNSLSKLSESLWL